MTLSHCAPRVIALLRVALVVAATLFVCSPALALDCSSTDSGEWSDATIWSGCGGGIPGEGDTARISDPDQITIPVDLDVTVDAIEFGVTGTTQKLTVLGSLVVGDVLHTANTIDGTGPITVTGTYDWIGNGSLNGGIEADETGAQLTFAEGSVWNLAGGAMALRQRDVVMDGNANWSAGTLSCSSRVTWHIAATAILSITHPTQLGSGGVDCRIRNEGIVRKTGTGEFRISDGRVRLENHGRIEVLEGGFDFEANGGPSQHGGVFATSIGAELVLPGAGSRFEPGTAFEGGGTVIFERSDTHGFGTSVVFPGPVQFALQSVNVDADAGVTLTYAGGLTWTAGRIRGPGTHRVPPSATLVIAGPDVKAIGMNALLQLEGTTLWQGGTIQFQSSNGPTTRLVNAAGARFEVQFRPASMALGNGLVELDNAGEFLAIAGDGSFTVTGLGTVRNSGSMTLAGTLDSTAQWRQIAGTMTLHDVTFDVPDSTRPLQLDGGSVIGNAIIDGEVRNDGALLLPGGAGGIGAFAIVGRYTESADAMVALDVGGSADGSFDQVVVSGTPGTATLAGALAVTQQAAFQFAPGTRVPIVVAGNRVGEFAGAQIDDAFAPPPQVLLRSDGVELALDASLFADGFE